MSDTLPPLLPCPFCGQAHTMKLTTAQELAEEGEDDPEPWMHSDSFGVLCDASRPGGPGGCGASGGFFPSEREAVDAWNRRAALAAAVAEPGAIHQWRTIGCADWYDGHPDHGDGGGPYETRTLYAAPPQRDPQWVPVAERLPEKFTEVLVAFAGQMSIASTGQYTSSPHDKNGWCYPAENNGICDDGSDPVVTHWMPLPDAPASAPKEQA